MIPAPVLLLLAKATLVLLVALGVTRLMRRASAGARHLVWLVSLAALLLVPALDAWGPLPVDALSALDARPSAGDGIVLPATDVAPPITGDAAPADIEPLRAEGHQAPATAIEPAAAGPQPTAVGAALAFAREHPLMLLLGLWAVVALGILASIAHAWLAVRRIVRRSEPLASRDWLDPLYEVADRLGLDDAPRVVRSEDAKMPFACGIAQPTIVLPAECDGWSVERRRAVLLHELAHVRRRDLLGHTLGRFACAIYWFHPLVWTAAQRLRSESERACDDLALVCGARAADYAEHLLDIVTSVRRDRTPIVALAMARPSEFEGRMLAILDPERPRRAASRLRTASLIGGLAAISLVVGAAAPAPSETRLVQAGTPASFDADTGRRELRLSEAQDARADERAEKHARKALEKGDFDPATEAMIDARAEARAQARVEARAGGVDVHVDVGSLGQVVKGAASAAVSGVIAGLLNGDGESLQGRARSERAELLAKVLRADTSASLRRVAAWGLHEFTSEAVASEALATALRRDASARVREMAAWALGSGESDHRAALEALWAAVRGDAEVEVRQTAAWALGQIEEESSVDALVAALADRDASVRYRAAWAIGSIEPRQAPRQLVALLADRDAKLREVVAWALYNIEDGSAAPALQAALRTEQDKELQLAYIRALASLGEKSIDAIRPLLESSDQRVRSMAVRALAGGDAAGPWPWPWPEPRPHP